MNLNRIALASLTVIGSVMTVGCGGGEDAPRERRKVEAAPGTQSASTPAANINAPSVTAGGAAGWGTIKGRIVWAGAEPAKTTPANVTKDQEWCNGDPKHPVLDYSQTIIVDPANKGIQGFFAYLKMKKPYKIHEKYPQTAADVKQADEAEFKKLNGVGYDEIAKAVADGKIKTKDVKSQVLIDQVRCSYAPHAVVAREGQRAVFLNYEDIAHNVKVASVGGRNESNNMMPAKNAVSLANWFAETNPLSIECSVHGWMKGYAMVFDHPYYAITGADGSFEIKDVPAGDVTLMLRGRTYIDPKSGAGGAAGAKGASFQLAPGEVKDLGEIKYDGK